MTHTHTHTLMTHTHDYHRLRLLTREHGQLRAHRRQVQGPARQAEIPALLLARVRGYRRRPLCLQGRCRRAGPCSLALAPSRPCHLPFARSAPLRLAPATPLPTSPSPCLPLPCSPSPLLLFCLPSPTTPRCLMPSQKPPPRCRRTCLTLWKDHELGGSRCGTSSSTA
jgi:hypothetical protein